MKSLSPSSTYNSVFKPAVDYILAIALILPILPIFLIVVLLLLIANRGKIFFYQERVGKDDRIFTVMKFRTMNEKKDSEGNLLPDEIRLTPIGKFIRKTSFDEIPQIFNVLKGDMSFIGPRPLLPEYLPYYSDIQRQRHLVKPGITGLAQVNGRNLTSWDRRFEMDIDYVERLSFRLDLYIFFMTIFKVIQSEGISAEGHATMPKFSDYTKQKSK